jgi:Fe-S oxidoreductase
MVAEDMPGELLATSYSCRSQVKRLSSRNFRHPLEILLEVYRDI